MKTSLLLSLFFTVAVVSQRYDGSIQVPGLGRPFSLGSLYDVRTDKLVAPGVKLWRKEILDKNTAERDMPFTDSQVVTSDSFRAKASLLDVGLEIQASFIGSLIEVSGAADFLKDRTDSHYEAEAIFRYHRRTHMRELNMEQIGAIEFPNVFDTSPEATHVVTRIDYGANAIFKFTQRGHSIEDRIDLQGKLKADVSFIFRGIEGSIHHHIGQQEKENYSSFECKFLGDVNLPEPPTTFLEAVESYKKLPTLINKTSSIPILIYLYPLSKLNSNVSRIFRRVDNLLLTEVRDRMRDYDNLHRDIGDLTLGQVYRRLPLFRAEVENFRLALTNHQKYFQSNLMIVLPELRGSTRNEEIKLANLLEEKDSLVKMEQLMLWSNWKKREEGALIRLISWKPEIIITDPSEFETMLYDNDVKHIVSLSLQLYSKSEPFTDCIKFNCYHNQSDGYKCAKLHCGRHTWYRSWLENHKIKRALRYTFVMYQRIVDLVGSNNHSNDKTAFVIREVSIDHREQIVIELYHDGFVIEMNFILPKIDIEIVEGNTIGRILQWSVKGSNETMKLVKSNYLVQHRKIGQLHWSKLKTDDSSITIPYPGDFEVTVAVMCTFGVCGVWKEVIHTKSPKALSLKVLLLGGFESVHAMSSMEYYYPYWPQYNSLVNATMLIPRYGHTSVVMPDEKVMTIGGINKGVFRDVEIFDPVTSKIIRGPSLNIARSNCDSTIIEDVIYVCGGWDGKNKLSSCERYRFGVWDYIAPMLQARSLLKLVPLNGNLYAIGGHEGGSPSDRVEIYNPNSNSWTQVQSMQTPRDSHGAAVLHGFIYVCGGDGTPTCERYKPRVDKWLNVTETMMDHGESMKLISDGKNLFAFGGDTDNSKVTVGMYEPKKDKWKMLKPLVYKRELASAVLLN